MLSQRTVERRVEEALASDDRWKVIVRGNSWLCPYCLRIGARELRMDEPIEERIALHFVRECTGWAYFEAEPQPIERLRHRARFLVFTGRVHRWFLDDRRFRFVDDAARWICPYCAEASEAEAPAHPLDDPAGWGAAPEESPFLEAVVAHLLACEAFARGEDRLRPVRDLEEARARSAARQRLERLRQRFERERSFQLVDQERRWLCPFCGIGQEVRLPAGRPDEATLQQAAAHLDLCKAFKVLGGRPLPVEELRERVEAGARARQLDKIRHKVSRHAIWRVRDLEGRWYCPYCAQQTVVAYPERAADGARDPERASRFFAAVLQHLKGCEDYRRPRAQVRERADLARAVHEANLAIDRHRRARGLLLRDPLYGVTDPMDDWLCPHCQRIQKHIHLGNDPESAVFEKTVEQVVRHLWGECEAFRDGEPPRVSRAELEELVAPAPAPAARPLALSDSAEAPWRRLKEDLEAMRTRVEQARRQESSLREARSKQLRLLPALPELPGYEFGRVYRPCDAVGGDFYHLFEAAPGQWAFAIGDISGHGIEAALLMGLAKKLLEVHGRGCTSPARTLCLANRDIYSDLDERTFVTVFYGLLDVERRRLRFARAGHDPLLLWGERREPHLHVVDSKGMALGMDAGPVFEQTIEELEVALEPGDLVLQVTDGVTEAMDPAGEQFGHERLQALLEEHGRHEVEYVLWRIEKALAAFAGGRPPADDVTLVGFKVLA